MDDNYRDDLPPGKAKATRSRKNAPYDDLYTASQVLHLTKIPRSTFERLVREKKIPRKVPSGRKEGYYPKAFINRLASRLQGRTSYGEVLSLIEQLNQEDASLKGATDWIRFDDLSFVQLLDIERYGPDQTVEMSVTYRWWEKNPYMCRILYNEQDRRDIWGALTIMPLPEAIIHRLLKQDLPEREIRPEDILTYNPGHTYDGYVASVIIRPQRQAHLRSLIKSMFDFWCQEYPGVRLKRLYAYGASPEGRKLIRHLFFSRRYDLGDNAWELDPMDKDNPSKLISSFQDCIKSKEF